LVNNEDNLSDLFTILKDVVLIQSNAVLTDLRNTTFPNGFPSLQKTDLQLAVYQFFYRFCEKLLVFYTEYKDQNLQQKKYLETFLVRLFEIISAQCIEIAKEMQTLMLRFYTYLEAECTIVDAKHLEIQMKNYLFQAINEKTNVYSLISLYISTFSTMEVDIGVMSPVAGSVISLIEQLCDYFKELKVQEDNLSKLLKPSFVIESYHPYIYELKEPQRIVCQGAERFKLNYVSSSQFPPMEFLRAIRFVDPFNKNELTRIIQETTSADINEIIVKDEFEVQFDYLDIKKTN